MTVQRRALRHVFAGVGILAGFGFYVMAAAAANDPGPTAHSDSVGAAISDTGLTAKVKSKFVGDDRLNNTHIKVVTTNAVVTLTGTAPSSDAKSAAEELARGVEGVKSVDDEITTPSQTGSMHKAATKTEREGSDSWITTKVKSEILADSVSKGFDVKVVTSNGVVQLSGTLRNPDAIAHVKDLAEKVKGVKSVDTSALITAAG